MLAAIIGALFVMPAAAQDDAATRARNEAARTGVAATRPTIKKPEETTTDAVVETPQKLVQSQDATAQNPGNAKAKAKKNQNKKARNQTSGNRAARNQAAQKEAPQNKEAPEKGQDGSVSVSGAGSDTDVVDALDSRAELIGGLALKDLQQTRQAPLFTPSRQQPKPPPPPKKVEKAVKPPAPPAPPKPPSLRLVGVVLTDESKIALMMAQDRSVKRLLLGDEIEGWSVVKLDPEMVELKLKGQRSVYRMFKPQAAGADGPKDEGPGQNRRKKKRKN